MDKQLYTAKMLANAERMAKQRGLGEDIFVVDVDAHHMDCTSELVEYIDQPWRRTLEHAGEQVIPQHIGDRYVAGRLKRKKLPSYKDSSPGELPAPIEAFKQASRQLGIDCSIVFPTDILSLGVHPQSALEVAVAKAYARWITERVLPYDPSIKTMLFLPFSDARASVELIEEFGEVKGVAGFMVTSVRHQPVYHNRYMKLYAALEERQLPIGFHTLDHWSERPFELFDNFLSAHTVGFPFFNMLQLVNVVMNGLPQRFPKLKWIFFEAGLAYLPFVMFRLDTAYGMRPSEAPILEKKPSEYMREFYYTTQPMEYPDDIDHLEALFDMVGRTQLLFSSDYPHWDFDTPSVVFDLPFLTDDDRRNILGLNAARLFGLDRDEIKEASSR